MNQSDIPQPKIAAQEEWLAQRKALLLKEKEAMRLTDHVSAERRRLPMVKIEKDYVFEGPEGKQTLKDLFKGQRQLIVYHFMFDPEWDKGCGGCTSYVNALGNLSSLEKLNTTFVLISRATLPKLEAYKAQKGWTMPWYSSFGSDFNYDYHVTLDENVMPIEYNYRTQEDLDNSPMGSSYCKGEEHGISVFFRTDEGIFHTYSAYARGTEGLTDTYALLDITPYGRQEDWEDSPAGRPQSPTYG